MSIKLIDGHYYRNRNGDGLARAVRIPGRNLDGDEYPFAAVFTDGHVESVTENGLVYDQDDENEDDLVAEVPPPEGSIAEPSAPPPVVRVYMNWKEFMHQGKHVAKYIDFTKVQIVQVQAGSLVLQESSGRVVAIMPAGSWMYFVSLDHLVQDDATDTLSIATH